MWKREGAIAATLLLMATAVSAQSAKPDGSAAEAAAAMERAKRQAAGPMRIILEASKPKRRSAEPEAPVASDTASVRSVGARTPALNTAPATPDVRTAAVSPSAVPNTAPSTATVAVPPPAVEPQTPVPSTPAAARPNSIVTQITLSSPELQGRQATASVPPLQAEALAERIAPASVPSASALPVPQAAAGPLRPRLLSMVEPELPQRMLDEMGRNTAVLIDLTLRTNGTVAAVNVLQPAPRQLQRFVAPALEQWKFEALPAQRVHRIELVFNADR